MAYKALIFGTEEVIDKTMPLYKREVSRGTFEIVGKGFFEDNAVRYVCGEDKPAAEDNLPEFDFAIVSSKRDLYQRIKFLEAQGIPHDKIIDGRVFQMPALDFPRFLKEGIAYGVLEPSNFDANSRMIYPKVYKTKNGKITLSLDIKSYIRKNSVLEGSGSISLGKFSSFATNIFFSLGQNMSHNYLNVGTVPLSSLDWNFPKNFFPPRGTCKILIGSDVWCGRGSTFKCTNPKKPLIIGDGAVIASDSVVVKSVPPYAIVGGNPAQVIKYRFSPEIIEALLRIKWWDWDIEKIHDNFKYFNDVEKFISLNDK